jgi:hypothetical protein
MVYLFVSGVRIGISLLKSKHTSITVSTIYHHIKGDVHWEQIGAADNIHHYTALV